MTQGVDADYEVTASGDWVVVDGTEALRQSLLRRIITNPGEWATKPEYGVGARQFVKAKNTPATRQALEERIRGQLMQDRRVAKVRQVTLELADGFLRIFVQVVPKGRSQRNEPLNVLIQVN